MEQTSYTTDDGRPLGEMPQCQAELHIRLCARRVPSGHLQFRWRIEAIDNIGHGGDSLDGSFGPFELPHESAQTMSGLIRRWLRHTSAQARAVDRDLDGEQGLLMLTLSELLSD